ncbi:MAG: hypothetical protein JNN01_22940 [Opitutaceae bacterium]|nr:hypothetical protein [Opitutaceae bacterium]
MSLTPDQSAAVSSWIASGDNLSAVQKKLREQFSVSLTFMEVRFLVDDLNLQLKDPAPKADANDLSKAAPAAAAKKPAGSAPAADAGDGDVADLPPEAELDDGAAPAAEDALLEDEGGPAGSIAVEVDKVTLHPGALASGTVTFSDGVTGKWIVDNYGRPGFTEVSQPGYRPKPADAQAFMQELSLQLQKRGY